MRKAILANTNLSNQRQVFVEDFVRSSDHLEAAKKVFFSPIPVIEYFLATFINLKASLLSSQETHLFHREYKIQTPSMSVNIKRYIN